MAWPNSKAVEFVKALEREIDSARIGKHCDQCAAIRVNGIFCHEVGCPNGKKTWVADRGEWVRFVPCSECGFDVEVGTVCECQSDMEVN